MDPCLVEKGDIFGVRVEQEGIFGEVREGAVVAQSAACVTFSVSVHSQREPRHVFARYIVTSYGIQMFMII